eukprot:GHRR01030741.1.p1 GENE.GHRR01030741.1~~GHRR01030741.1.p1  ORF type:complete len:109 (+),score=23.40 GHRR01030741.1:276-602(+)
MRLCGCRPGRLVSARVPQQQQARTFCNMDLQVNPVPTKDPTCKPHSSSLWLRTVSANCSGVSKSYMQSLIRLVPNVAIRQPTAGPTAALRLMVPAATISSAADSSSPV